MLMETFEFFFFRPFLDVAFLCVHGRAITGDSLVSVRPNTGPDTIMPPTA